MKAIKYALLGLVGVIGLVVSTFGPLKIPFAESLAKTYYRYAIAGLLVVVLLLGGLIAIAVQVLDPNQFKTQIVRWVQDRTQRELALEGELKVSWFPKLALETGKASLSQRRSAREFASLDSARVTLAWLPLLRGNVRVDRCEIVGLRAQVARFKDGTTNIDDLLRDAATISPASIDLDGVQLSRSTLQWNDEIDWQRGSLNDLQIDLGRLTDGQAGPLTASARIDAPNAGVDARLQVKGRVLFDSKTGRIEWATLVGQLEGKALGIDNLALGLSGDATGHPAQHALSAENVVVTTASKSGLSVFNARLVAPELKYHEQHFSGSQLSIDASVAHPDQTVTAALQWPSFEWSSGALRGAAATAQLSVRGAGTHLRAQLTSPMMLHLDAGPRLDLEAIELSASASHPALAADVSGSASGKLEFDMALQTARLTLAGKLAGHDVRGELGLADFRRPRWVMDVAASSLDLDTLLAKPWLARWSDDATPFDVAFLRELTLLGQLRADRFKLGGVQLSELSAQFDAQRTTLSVAPITAQAYGGALDAAATIAASAGPRLAFKGSLSGVDTRALLADVSRAPWIEGKGEFGWELRAEGGSVGTLRSGIAGNVAMAIQGGSLSGIDLRAALLEGQADIGTKGAIRKRAVNFGELTRFVQLKTKFELNDGRALAPLFELKSDALLAAGAGELALDSGLLDMRLNTSVLGIATARATPELAALAGAHVPVRVAGPWRQPSFAFDFGSASAHGQRPHDGGADATLASAAERYRVGLDR